MCFFMNIFLNIIIFISLKTSISVLISLIKFIASSTPTLLFVLSSVLLVMGTKFCVEILLEKPLALPRMDLPPGFPGPGWGEVLQTLGTQALSKAGGPPWALYGGIGKKGSLRFPGLEEG